MMFADLNYSNIYCTDLNNICTNKFNSYEDGVIPWKSNAVTRFSDYNNIQFKQTDALDINFPDSTFDVIGCKSLLGGIAKKDSNKMKIAIKEIYRVLKKNGSFIFAENIEGHILHKIIRTYLTTSGWYYPNLKNFVSTLDDFNKINYRTTGFFTILSRNEKIKSKLFLVDDLIKNIIPEKSKYLIYGIAEK